MFAFFIGKKEMKFIELKINKKIEEAIAKLDYEEMTPIQEATLPVVLEGKDVIAQAPTGTGKTACFAIPAVQMVDVNNENIQVMILCPTRELAMQVTAEVKKFALKTENLRVITVYGGQDIELQIKSLKKKPQIIVGTPGRIMDHMRRHTIDINEIKMLVLDEADEMLDMGFKEDLDIILKDVNNNRQTLLFSATMPDTIKKISKQYQKEAIFIKTTYEQTDLPNVHQYYVEIDESNKVNCLSRMIDVYNFKQALVFCRTKKKVDELSMALTSRKYGVECLHGDLRQAGREKVMDMFRNGLVRVLIATDVAARGLDVEGIDAVFNYDVPDDVEYYIHRIGRTARAGRDGAAYTFVTRKEVVRIKEFMEKTKTEIVKVSPPNYREAEAKKVEHILEDLINNVKTNDMTIYLDYINKALNINENSLTGEALAAGFLYQLIVSDSRFSDAGLDLENSKSSKKGMNKDYSRIFINLGRKDGLNVVKLVNLICQKHTIGSDKVQGIDIMNTYSFFEIPTACVDEVLGGLNGEDYNGRRIDTEVSTGKKKESPDSNKEYRRDASRRDGKSSRQTYKDSDHKSSRSYQKTTDTFTKEKRPVKFNSDDSTDSKAKKVRKPRATTTITKTMDNVEEVKSKGRTYSKTKDVNEASKKTYSKRTTRKESEQQEAILSSSKQRSRKSIPVELPNGKRHQNNKDRKDIRTKSDSTKKKSKSYISKSF